MRVAGRAARMSIDIANEFGGGRRSEASGIFARRRLNLGQPTTVIAQALL